MLRFAALYPILFGFVGCFAPKYGNGDLQCAAGRVCPPGLFCAADNRCYFANTDLAVALDLSDNADLSSPSDGGGVVRHQGQACGAGDSCDTGYCVDGYCCNSGCTGACQACNVPSNLGTCTIVVAGATPVGARSCNAQPKSSCGPDGACDGMGHCRDWASGTVCASGSCNATDGSYVNPSTCDGMGTCVPNGGGNCAPYKCQNASQCFNSCVDASQCSSGNSCTNSSCGKLSNGRSCSSNIQCLSGNCVDGYCCDTACTNQCQACDVAGRLGTCSTVTSGQPHGTRTICTGSGTLCGGSCTGSASCSYPASQCIAPSCSSGNATLATNCDGAGHCPTPMVVACTPYVCGATACANPCGGDTDCIAADYCASGSCVPRQSNGATCNASNQCVSGNCVDGYCCDGTCTAQCQACDVAGKQGTCSAVPSGQPHGSRGACNGAGTSPCGGYCNGTQTTCFYTTVDCSYCSTKVIGGLSSHAIVQQATCQSGACNDGGYVDCQKYACNSSTLRCGMFCCNNGDCGPSYSCSGANCSLGAHGTCG